MFKKLLASVLLVLVVNTTCMPQAQACLGLLRFLEPVAEAVAVSRPVVTETLMVAKPAIGATEIIAGSVVVGEVVGAGLHGLNSKGLVSYSPDVPLTTPQNADMFHRLDRARYETQLRLRQEALGPEKNSSIIAIEATKNAVEKLFDELDGLLNEEYKSVAVFPQDVPPKSSSRIYRAINNLSYAVYKFKSYKAKYSGLFKKDESVRYIYNLGERIVNYRLVQTKANMDELNNYNYDLSAKHKAIFSTINGARAMKLDYLARLRRKRNLCFA